jgi:chromosome segregation ATPase
VSRLAQQLWELAVGAAHEDAEQALAQERLQLDAQRRDVETREESLQSQLQAATAAAAQADQARAAAEQRLTDLQRASDIQQLQMRDLSAQREALEFRSDRLEAELIEQQRRATHRDETLTAERASQSQYFRELEDRAHAEVDRARQEAKSAQAKLDAHLQRREAETQNFRDKEEVGRRALRKSEQEAAIQRSRADTLERQLQQVRVNMPAAQSLRTPTRKPRSKSKPAI